ncbi:MAG: hypothetical protein PHS97_05900 [Oscillospiraceae bacterium]|nr:hypothetical protein [Oscillospiraceae bacterium]
MTDTELLASWAIHKIKTEYPEDIDLLIAVDGAEVGGDGHGKCFDYFIPRTERGNELSQTFVLGDGIGTDLYPRSWERTEATVALKEGPMACIANARILYSRTPSEADRFTALQQKFWNQLRTPAFVCRGALERLKIATELFCNMLFEEQLFQVRMAAGFVFDYLSEGMLLLNGCSAEMFGRIGQLEALPGLEPDFLLAAKALPAAESVETVRELCRKMIYSYRKTLESEKVVSAHEGNKNAPDFYGLADWYQELALHWRRLRCFCAAQNASDAFLCACNLQYEINIVVEEYLLGAPAEFDLLGAYCAENLLPLVFRADELEKKILSAIESHGISISRYDTVREFLTHN